MKYCVNCGSQYDLGITNCEKCGYKFNEDVKTEVKSEVATHPDKLIIVNEKVKNLSRNYWGYFTRTLNEPKSCFLETKSSYGIMQFFILTLAQVMTLWFLSFDSFLIVPVRFYFIVFFYLFLFNVIPALTVFIMRAFFYKSKDSFFVTITQYGGLYSLYLIILTVIMLFSLIPSEPFATLIVILSLANALIYLMAFVVYLNTFESKIKLDKYYVSLIGFGILFLLIFIWLRIFNATGLYYLERMMGIFW